MSVHGEDGSKVKVLHAKIGEITIETQNVQQFYWKEDHVNGKLLDIMNRAYNDVLMTSRTCQVNLREAAYLLALERVAEASRLRGLD